MNGLPYYKAYPRDFIEGTIGMPFEIKCAYRVVLDLIYMQGGRLPDDARYISGLLGCTMRKWASIRGTLLEAGKLHREDGILTNYRAIIELETLAKLQDKQRENASGPRKNKGLQKPRLSHTEPEPDKSVVANATTSPEPDKSAPVAFELPCVSGDPYQVREDDIAEWRGAFPAVDVRQQLGAMRSWLIANPTRKKTRKGMRRFIVTWLDKKQNDGGQQAQPRAGAPPNKPLTQGESLRNMARQKGIIDDAGNPIRRLETSDRDREDTGSGHVVRLAIAGNYGW